MLVELVLKFLVVANEHNFIEGLLLRPFSVDSSPILHRVATIHYFFRLRPALRFLVGFSVIFFWRCELKALPG